MANQIAALDFIIGGYMLLNLKDNRRAQLICKIIGSLLSLTGIFLAAKYRLHLVGLILILVGIYFAILLGRQDLQ